MVVECASFLYKCAIRGGFKWGGGGGGGLGYGALHIVLWVWLVLVGSSLIPRLSPCANEKSKGKGRAW